MDIGFFRRHSLTRGLSQQELTRLDTLVEPRSFAAGEKIFIEGAATYGLFLLQEGSVSVSREGTVITTLEAPTVLGEVELVASEPAAATVVAATDVRAYILTHDAFERLVDEGDSVVSKLMRNMARVMARRLIDNNERAVFR